MILSDQPDTITLVAAPPIEPGFRIEPAANAFIDQVVQNLASKKAAGHRVVRVGSVRQADLELAKLLPRGSRTQVRLQVIGHSISGVLSLGASWLPEDEVAVTAFAAPHLVLDTNPAALGLLAKYAGKLTEVMLVGCNVGSATSFGYAINGRTLTYTLAELLRCRVLGADDVVSPDELDARGWYAPAAHHRRPKGWRWSEAAPPAWIELGTDPVARPQTHTAEAFHVTAITRSLLPFPIAQGTGDLGDGLLITCSHVTADAPRSALPELVLETDQGPAELLCGGRYLRVGSEHFVVDPNPRLIAAMRALWWSVVHDAAGLLEAPAARSAG
jgi:hypothetical protein